MKRFIHILILVIVVIYSRYSYAQEHTVLMLDELPQSNYFNPALAPKSSGYIIAPGISGISLGFENTGFCFDDAFQKDKNDTLYFNLNKLSDKISDYNLTTANIEIPIFGVGFTVKKNFFTISATNKTRADIVVPASILDIRYGNYNYKTEKPVNHSLSDLYTRAFNYFEYAVGFNRAITDRIRLGVKAKLLMGNFALYSNKLDVKIETIQDDHKFIMDVYTNGEIYTSAPLNVTHDEEGYVDEVEWDSDIMSISSSKNTGVAFDLGVTYNLTDKVTIGASVLDLGFISWKETPNTFVSNNNFTFSGVNINGSVKDDPETKVTDTYWDQLKDSLTRFADLRHKTKTFKTPLSANALIHLSYKPFKWLQAGGVVSGVIVDKRLYARVSCNLTLRAKNWLAYIASLSIDPGYATSIGHGLALTAPGFQFFVIAERLPLSTLTSRSAQLRFGFNFPIGRDKTKFNTDMNEKTTNTEENTIPEI